MVFESREPAQQDCLFAGDQAISCMTKKSFRLKRVMGAGTCQAWGLAQRLEQSMGKLLRPGSSDGTCKHLSMHAAKSAPGLQLLALLC
jgi:hypothetical protein